MPLLIFRYPPLPLITSNFSWVIINICKFYLIPLNIRKDPKKIYDPPALAGTSWIHCSSTSLFLPFLPHLLTQSCFSSSQTFFSRTLCWIPFAAANLSHLVGGLGLGRGFALGNWKTGGGRIASGPSGDVFVGNLKSEAIRAWTLSRANVWRWSSKFSLTKKVGIYSQFKNSNTNL